MDRPKTLGAVTGSAIWGQGSRKLTMRRVLRRTVAGLAILGQVRRKQNMFKPRLGWLRPPVFAVAGGAFALQLLVKAVFTCQGTRFVAAGAGFLADPLKG